MTIQEMKERKKELGYSNSTVAELSGVPLGTVQKIFSGATASPRYETLRALEAVLKKKSVYPFSEGNPFKFGESVMPYLTKKQGEYTLKDYYNLPEDKRFELIDGVIYDMTAPTTIHQSILGRVHANLLYHIDAKGGQCIPMISPVDVQLDCDDKTMVEPDVIIVCDRSKIIRKCVYGAPDFVMEVLSKSSKKKDMFIKLNKYLNAGVREYWIVDPDKKVVMIYDFEHDDYRLASFDDKIPVSVLDNECIIDFAALYDRISFLYEQE
ncbi:Uma2 family endonuclease [Ihubacter sp. mB4P-1]|uniref:Uma2 family endonuclease n=1 Tax=Ihubacter sp. mB4P-1 TaxID=3242370 RepID=UPI001379BA00